MMSRDPKMMRIPTTIGVAIVIRLVRDAWKTVAADAKPTIPEVTPRITTIPTRYLPRFPRLGAWVDR
jgi:hypothetical protein